MIEFMRGIWTPLRTTSMPASVRTASNRAGNFPSRSADQEPRSAAGVLEIHDQILRRLRHPRGGRVRGRAQDPDPSVGVLDHREHVQPRSGQGDRFEEVARQQGVGLRAQEVGPRAAGAQPASIR
jgi:hypothetical protein